MADIPVQSSQEEDIVSIESNITNTSNTGPPSNSSSQSRHFSDRKSLTSVSSRNTVRLNSSDNKWDSSPAKIDALKNNTSQRTSSAKSKRTLSCKSAKFSRRLLNRTGVDSESQNELMKNILITQFDKYVAYADDDVSDDSDPDNDNVFSLNDSDQAYFLDDEDADYDTDLEVDIDEWLNEEKCHIGIDLTGEKKYLASCEITGVVPASYFVRNIEENDVCMRFHGLGPEGVRAMCVPLKTNSKIEKLDLEGNDMEQLGCLCLSDMLKENIYITKLVLSNNRIGNDGVITLCEILKRNDAVTSLDISGNELTDVAASHISDMLQKNATLKHLFLSHNRFEEKAADDFYEALSQNEALESLDLSWNRFRTKGAVCIAEGVQENYGLKSINLCMNGFGTDGASAMGKALKVNRTLQDLDLCFNRIPDAGVDAISIGLQTNDVLKSLKIGSNPFGGDSALYLLKSVDKNDSSALKYLELLNIEITREFIDLKKIMEVERAMKIVHGGIVNDDRYDIPTLWRLDDVDSQLSKDPMSILKKYIVASGYRLIDLFKDFDKDGNMFITREEFARGLQNAKVEISPAQLEDLLLRLDKDKNGQIDFAELMEGDKEYRELQRKLLKQKLEAQNDQTY